MFHDYLIIFICYKQICFSKFNSFMADFALNKHALQIIVSNVFEVAEFNPPSDF